MTIESDRELALKTLREICEKSDAPAQSKASAARTILEVLGDIGRLQEIKKDSENKLLSEMSKSELDLEIAKIARPVQTIPVEARRTRPNTFKPSKRKYTKRKVNLKNAQSATTKYDF